MPVPAILIEAGIAAVGKLTSAIADSVAFYDDAQKASLTLGMTFGDATNRLGSSMDGLRGTFETKLAGGFEILDAGFQGNITSMSYVTNQMKLLGQNTKKLHVLNQDLSFKLGLNSKEVGDLNVSMLETSRRFGVSMDKVVESVAGLAKSFPILLASGARSNTSLVDAVANLGANLGEQDKGELNKFVNKLFADDVDTVRNLVATDMIDSVEQLFKGGLSTEETEKLLTKLISQGATTFDTFSTEGLVGFGRARISANIASKELTISAKLLNEAFKKERQISTASIDAGSTFSNVLSETFDITRFGKGMAESMTGRTSVDPTYVKIVGNTQPDSLGKTSLLNDANSNNIKGAVSNSNDILTKLYGATLDANHQRGTAAEDKKFERTVIAIENLGNGE